MPKVIHILGGACWLPSAPAELFPVMTTAEEVTPVRLSGPEGLLAAVPALLGFHPADSLVMICIAGPGRRVGPVVRMDLQPEEDVVIATMLRHARRQADIVALVLYSEDAGRPVILHRLVAELLAADVGVLDALQVRDGRGWPLGPVQTVYGRVGPTGEQSFPVPGPANRQVQAMSAAIALTGRGVLPDREALAQSIAGPTGAAADRAVRAFHLAADRLLAVLETARMTSPDPVVERALHTAGRGVRQVAHRGVVDEQLAAELALLTCDVPARDALIAAAMTELDRDWLPMLISAAGLVVDCDAAGLCSLLAITAYRHGDGALAQVSLDRCLSAEPDHRLALLLVDALTTGMPPAELADLVAAASHSDPPAALPPP